MQSNETLLTPPSDTSNAILEWQRCLGPDHVLLSPKDLASYTRNVSALKREIIAILKPTTTLQVQEIVLIANRFKTPLYPISGGKNWGFGSRLPVQSGAAIVDLGLMNRILEVNTEFHYAVVEAGVTQRQLFDHIQKYKLPLMMDVTGSGADSSLLGNSLERGIGYFHSRADSLSGMEVVLGNGKIIRTGFSHYPNSQTTHLYKHGVGPCLDGLFSQSNFGIVTSAAVELFPKPEVTCGMMARLNNPHDFIPFVTALSSLRKSGTIQTVIHLANRHRMQITMGPLLYKNLSELETLPHPSLLKLTEQILSQECNHSWSAVTGLKGSRDQIKLDQRKIYRALKPFATVRFMTQQKLEFAHNLCSKLSSLNFFRHKLAFIKSIRPLFGLTMGIPTNAALGSVLWPIEKEKAHTIENPDHSRSGLLYCVPLTRMDGASAWEVYQFTDEICKKHNFQHHITINFINTKSIEFVINIAFDRENPAQGESAHRCMEELHDRCIMGGHHPYRVGPYAMSKILSDQDPFWQTTRDLKKSLDPHHIISPGRYNLV